jgi:hypothetical protein
MMPLTNEKADALVHCIVVPSENSAQCEPKATILYCRDLRCDGCSQVGTMSQDFPVRSREIDSDNREEANKFKQNVVAI